MNPPIHGAGQLIHRASQDPGFRQRLLDDPKRTIEEAFGVTLGEGQQVFVHESSETETHLVLPPVSRRTPAEREAARTGVASLEFLRKTLHDPAPPMRAPAPVKAVDPDASAEDLVVVAREAIGRALEFLQSSVSENGAWHCIRFNIADPAVPRHFERPAFVSAFCVLALQGCGDARAKALCEASRAYLVDTMEYPGLWRYYRHLPQDLDSTTLCSLVLDSHPWIALGQNMVKILSNRDTQGRFLTWVLGEDEPDVVSKFRIEADPVVNANVIAYLGDHPQTRPAQRWLEELVREDRVHDTSKWYPDTIAIYYAITRAHGARSPRARVPAPNPGGPYPRSSRPRGRVRQPAAKRPGGFGARQRAVPGPHLDMGKESLHTCWVHSTRTAAGRNYSPSVTSR